MAWGLSAFGAAGVLWRPRLLLVVIFGSSVLLGLLSLTFLWTMPHGFFMGFGSGGFAGQSGAVEPWFLGQALVLFALWKHDALYDVLTDDCIDFRLEKIQRINPSR